MGPGIRAARREKADRGPAEEVVGGGSEPLRSVEREGGRDGDGGGGECCSGRKESSFLIFSE